MSNFLKFVTSSDKDVNKFSKIQPSQKGGWYWCEWKEITPKNGKRSFQVLEIIKPANNLEVVIDGYCDSRIVGQTIVHTINETWVEYTEPLNDNTIISIEIGTSHSSIYVWAWSNIIKKSISSQAGMLSIPITEYLEKGMDAFPFGKNCISTQQRFVDILQKLETYRNVTNTDDRQTVEVDEKFIYWETSEYCMYGNSENDDHLSYDKSAFMTPEGKAHYNINNNRYLGFPHTSNYNHKLVNRQFVHNGHTVGVELKVDKSR